MSRDMKDKIELISVLRDCFSGDKLCMNYHGIFDDMFTEQLISLAECDVDKKAKKKMALLVSECFQNIVRHGDTELSKEKTSLFGIRGTEHFLHIFSTNLVTDSTREFLEKKLDEINHLDKDQIKNLYYEVLENGNVSLKGGAGLGLIEMARKSGRPLQKDFRKIGDNVNSFYLQIDLIQSDFEETDVIPEPLSIIENQSVHDLIEEHKIVFLYKGDFSEESMFPILHILIQNTDIGIEYSEFILFHSTVELMQNITRHAKRTDGKTEGLLSMNKTANGHYLCTGNPVDGNLDEMVRFIEEINQLSKVELDILYRKALKENIRNADSSAGIGLLDLRRTTMTTIDVKIVTDSNGSYLMIGLEIPFTDGK